MYTNVGGKRRSIQKGKGTLITKTDGDQRNEMLTKESKIHKHTDNGVDLNEDKCSLQSHKNVSIEHNL